MARNFSVNKYFVECGNNFKPSYRFTGNDKAAWSKWHDSLLPAIKETLGVMPKKVPLNPEIICEWTDDGLNKRKLVFDVEEGLSAEAYLFWPQNAKGKLPAILACHGHGEFGKEPVMGNTTSAELRASIARCNYDYGLQMAKAGFAVIAIDWRGFGVRDDRRKPNWNNMFWNRDICNIHYIRANIMGMTVLGMNIHDGKCALDYLCSQDFVDADRIGVMGLSFGGTMTTWMSLCDERIKATDIICYSDRFKDFAMRDCNFCGSQITPGLFSLCDVPDLQGLIAPRPLLVEMGTHDDCFLIDSAMSCFHEVEKIYSAAGCREKLELDLFEGGHQWGGNKSAAFFKKYL